MGFSVKNETETSLNLTIFPVQKREDRLQVTISAGETYKSSIKNCVMYAYVSNTGVNDTFWEGAIPTCVSQPVIINADGIVSYAGVSLPNNVNRECFFTSKGMCLLYVVLLLAICAWVYTKRMRK